MTGASLLLAHWLLQYECPLSGVKRAFTDIAIADMPLRTFGFFTSFSSGLSSRLDSYRNRMGATTLAAPAGVRPLGGASGVVVLLSYLLGLSGLLVLFLLRASRSR
jgi:hypothetical protein